MNRNLRNFRILACVVLLSTLVVGHGNKNTKLKVGSYTGKANQTTEYNYQKTGTRDVEITIKIDSIDSDGNIKGEFVHETLGKGGSGGLTGKIDDSDKLQLKGSLTSQFGDKWQITLNATVGDKVLTDGQYRLEAKTTTMTGLFKTAELQDND